MDRAPSPTALNRLQYFAERSKRQAATFPVGFVRDEVSEAGPMLAQLVKGGRGGEVRLKLLVSMHLIAGGGKRDDVTRSPVSWAQMLDLPEPETNGARRVRDGCAWLEDHQLIVMEHHRGKEPTVFLRSALGDGGPYARQAGGGGSRYIRVPVSFWHHGWIVTLSGTALAMWLVLAEMQGGREKEKVWVSPPDARQRYRLSEETFAKGVWELAEHNLVSITKEPQGAAQWLYNRYRNGYQLDFGRLEERPFSEPDPEHRPPPAPVGRLQARAARARAAVAAASAARTR